MLLGLLTFVPSTAQAAPRATNVTHVVTKKKPKKKKKAQQKANKKSQSKQQVVWPIEPGHQGPMVKDIQNRLKMRKVYSGKLTGYYNPATEQGITTFQTNQGLPATGKTDRVTYKKLKEVTDAMMPKVDRRCLTGRVLCIDKRSRSLRWMINGKVLRTVDVRFGSRYTPTREGQFRVFLKSRNHVSSIYHTSMPFAMFFSGGQAVHFSPDFLRKGYSGASHGCVNVRDYGAIRSIFDQVRTGDKVVIYWSK
jgi:lipoprotein-anchoring transpeptidase ErfK/SrfK